MFNKIIFRKPKFMRNDEAAATYMKIAKACAREACKVQDVDERYGFLLKAGTCVNEAAKQAGFFRTKDYTEWLIKQEINYQKV